MLVGRTSRSLYTVWTSSGAERTLVERLSLSPSPSAMLGGIRSPFRILSNIRERSLHDSLAGQLPYCLVLFQERQRLVGETRRSREGPARPFRPLHRFANQDAKYPTPEGAHHS